jgi:hypothetical protein
MPRGGPSAAALPADRAGQASGQRNLRRPQHPLGRGAGAGGHAPRGPPAGEHLVQGRVDQRSAVCGPASRMAHQPLGRRIGLPQPPPMRQEKPMTVDTAVTYTPTPNPEHESPQQRRSDDETGVAVFVPAFKPPQSELRRPSRSGRLQMDSRDDRSGESDRSVRSPVPDAPLTIDTSPTALRSARRQGSKRIAPTVPGQAVAGGSLVWRRRRLRVPLSAVAVVAADPGLRPRFFSVLPTPANFRSR